MKKKTAQRKTNKTAKTTKPQPKKRFKLYWCVTDDHDEDWFVVATTKREATCFFRDYEGYGYGDVVSEEILTIPAKIKAETGHPSMKLLKMLGFEQTQDTPRVMKLGERTFHEGNLQHKIDTHHDNVFESQGQGRPNRTTGQASFHPDKPLIDMDEEEQEAAFDHITKDLHKQMLEEPHESVHLIVAVHRKEGKETIVWSNMEYGDREGIKDGEDFIRSVTVTHLLGPGEELFLREVVFEVKHILQLAKPITNSLPAELH